MTSETAEWRVCHFCGEKIPRALTKCRYCGELVKDGLHEDGRRFYKNDPGPDENLQWLVPIGRSGWAIAAGYLGLLSCFPYVGLVFGALAVVMGVLALRASQLNPRVRGRQRAIFGIILGSLAGAANLALTAATIYGAVNGWK